MQPIKDKMDWPVTGAVPDLDFAFFDCKLSNKNEFLWMA
jgi:hypothetical protein